MNWTARMCAFGEYNRVHISSETHDVLVTKCNDIEYQQREIEAKGLGLVTTYFVQKKRNIWNSGWRHGMRELSL